MFKRKPTQRHDRRAALVRCLRFIAVPFAEKAAIFHFEKKDIRS